MQAKDLFKEIVKDDYIINNSNLDKNEILCLSLGDKVDDNHIYILKMIINSMDNKLPKATTYKNIKKFFEIK